MPKAAKTAAKKKPGATKPKKAAPPKPQGAPPSYLNSVIRKPFKLDK